MADAHMKMGNIFRQLGATEDAFKEYQLAHEITEKRAKARPDSDASQSNLAATFTVMGDMSQQLHRDMAAALGYYEKALALREQLYRHPKGGEPTNGPTARQDGV